MTVVHRNSDKVFTWPSGEANVLNLVHPTTMTLDSIPGFFGRDGESVTPVSVISSSKLMKAIAISSSAGKGFFNYCVGQGQGKLPQSSVIGPRTGCVTAEEIAICLEASMDESIFFVGGSSNTDLSKGVAKLWCLTFDDKLKILDEIELRTGANNSSWATASLRRFGDKDVLMAGTLQSLYVVEWTGTHFCVLNVVEDLHSGRWQLTKASSATSM